MASDDRPDDRPRFTLRRFFTSDEEPQESTPPEAPGPPEAFGTGDVDDDTLDAIVGSAGPSALVWNASEVPPPVSGAGSPPAEEADQASGDGEGDEASDPFDGSHMSVDEFVSMPVDESPSAEDEDLPLSFEPAVFDDEAPGVTSLDALADSIDPEDLGDPFELSDLESPSEGVAEGADGAADGAEELEPEDTFWETTSAAETDDAAGAGPAETGRFGFAFDQPETDGDPLADATAEPVGSDWTAPEPASEREAAADETPEESLVFAAEEVPDAAGSASVAGLADSDAGALEEAMAVPEAADAEPVAEVALPDAGPPEAKLADTEAETEAIVAQPESVAPETKALEADDEVVEVHAEAAEVHAEAVDVHAEAVEVDAAGEAADGEAAGIEPDVEGVDLEPELDADTEPETADLNALEAEPEAIDAAPEAADAEPEATDLGDAAAAAAAVGALSLSESVPPDPTPMETAEIAADLTTAQTTAAVDEAFEGQSDPAKAASPGADGIEGDLEVRPLGPDDFAPEELRAVLRTMMLSRKLDEKMLTLLKQGKGFFHIGSAGHEASQTAVARQFKGGHDWFCLYYRDLATALTVGLTPADVLRAHYGKAADVFGGGRQMPEHFGHRDLNIMSTSSSVGAQYVPAVGFALAVQREDGEAETSRAVYASGGEGSTSQGAFHEALNWAAREALPVLFHIQDNKFAISVPVEEQTAGGSIWHLLGGYAGLRRLRYDGTDFFQSAAAAKAAMDHIRAGNGPVALHADLVRLLPHSSSDDHKKYREAASLEADAARDPIPRLAGQLVEAGVMTEAEVESLRAEVAAEIDRLAKEIEREADPDPATATAHVYYEGPDTRAYEQPGEAGDLIVMVDAINHALDEEMTRDERVLVYGEDVGGGKGGVFTATRGLTAKHGRDRCFNSPLAEHSVLGSAVGLACAGYKPVVEIQFADYIWPGMQPLRNQIASMRYRSNDAWACPMVIRVPAGGYIHGGLCHSQNIEALFAHWPGLHVVMPSNAADAKGLLKSAIRGEDPVLFLEHKALYRQGPARRPEPHGEYLVPLGKAAIAREGTDLTIVTWGAIVYKALAAAKALEKEGVSVEVIDVRSFLPFDSETVLASVRKTGRVLIAYEDHEFMGFGAEIAAQVADGAFGHLDAPVKRVAGAFSSIPYADSLEKEVLPQDANILNAAREVLAY